MTEPLSFEKRFSTFFERPVAERAAAPLSVGAEIELKIGEEETFTFTRVGGKNGIRSGAARSPQVTFRLTAPAAERVLSIQSDDIGEIGVEIARMILSPEPGAKVGIQIHAGLFSLVTMGYLGVIAAGGASFASYLASKGINGASAIKAALGKKKG